MAVPFWPAGAKRETCAGRLASRKLKPMKNTNTVSTRGHKDCDIAMANEAAMIIAIAEINICFSICFFAAMMIIGTINTNDSSKTGK